jgi:hypothetical protein
MFIQKTRRGNMGVRWDDKLRKSVSLYEEGHTIKEVHEITGVSKNRMTLALKELGVEVRRMGSVPSYQYRQDAFSAIDTQEKAYWLGFLYADGSVSTGEDRFSLGISKKDRGHLEEFRNFICPDKPIENLEGQKAVRVTVTSKKITSDLIKAGCVPQKSLILKAPTEDIVPKHLVHHFIRGYFDGDGCARLSKNETRVSVNFTGTEDILNYIVKYFKDKQILFKSKPRKVKQYNAWRWECEATTAVRGIYNHLYWDSHTHLNRKRLIMIRAFGLNIKDKSGEILR